eukprot:365509-Chlamydomonas_euryale.AAC.25
MASRNAARSSEPSSPSYQAPMCASSRYDCTTRMLVMQSTATLLAVSLPRPPAPKSTRWYMMPPKRRAGEHAAEAVGVEE